MQNIKLNCTKCSYLLHNSLTKVWEENRDQQWYQWWQWCLRGRQGAFWRKKWSNSARRLSANLSRLFTYGFKRTQTLPYFVHIIESSNKIQHNHNKTGSNYNLCFSFHFLQKLMCFSFVPWRLKVRTEVSQSQGLICANLITFMQIIKTVMVHFYHF